MKAVILAGGLGTRLRPVTLEIPKPLIPVQGKTLTEHVFDILKRAGVDDVVLSVGFGADKIKKYFGEQFCGLNISYLEESEPLGTGGWMNLIVVSDSDFFVSNGDNLLDIDLRSVLKHHVEKGAVCTIVATRVEDASQYGSLVLENDKILDFLEKSKEISSGWVNSGYYVFNKKIFEFIPDKDKFMLEKDVFPLLAEKGLLNVFKSEGQWFDTGTFERWAEVIEKWRK